MNAPFAFVRRLALALPPLRRLYESRNALADRVAALEARPSAAGNVFYHYHSVFDAESTIRSHANVGAAAVPELLTNFLGVRVDPRYLPAVLSGMAGTCEPVPIPANWHADIAEWAACLRAVDLSRQTFCIMELGCGWGCWLNNAGVAARRAGRQVHLIGIEGDEGHVQFAREACALNGFSPDELDLYHGVAGAGAGVAFFPKQTAAGHHWGLEPLFNPPDAEALRQSGQYDPLPIIGLDTLARGRDRIDLLHVDIQGGEADLVEASLSFLNDKAAYLVIGTHGRELEGRLFTTLRQAGWVLEIERPAILSLAMEPAVVVDGVQGWRNPALLPLP